MSTVDKNEMRAEILSGLGKTCLEMSVKSGNTELADRAIKFIEEALEFYVKESYPIKYAECQMSMGNAYLMKAGITPFL